MSSTGSSDVKSNSQTVLRGDVVACETPSDADKADHFGQFFRTRSLSTDVQMLSRSTSRVSQGSLDLMEVKSEDDDVRLLHTYRVSQQVLNHFVSWTFLGHFEIIFGPLFSMIWTFFDLFLRPFLDHFWKPICRTCLVTCIYALYVMCWTLS